jgi:hypothetical protein
MIKLAKAINLEFQKNEQRKERLKNRLQARRKFLSEFKLDQKFNPHSYQIFVDPVSLYLYLTMEYWRRVEKRSIKTMNIEFNHSLFINEDSPLLDEAFEKVTKQFAKHQIKMTVQSRDYNGNPTRWKISLKTLELY